MDDIIHLLPDSVANQIAAGEVVQRPSSIIKEMVENSIDAGAQNIQVLVVDGGKTNVQVIDDGKGMSETDARLSFERHATSKILKAADLFNLTTMGFRGEALASIAAVAQVDLKTRRPEDELGTYIQIAGSKLERQEPIACPVGSNFAVKNLFFNVPARRKYLKSNQTELTNVISDFQRIVLVHPNISFTLYNNGVETYRLPASPLRQRIIDVFGKKINAELLPLEVETSLVGISGYVAKPESSKKKGSRQFFFVNGRYMRHPYFHNAVMKAFENLIPAGEQVSYFIYFSVDPANIDVNVHPTKTEIKFENEQAIWQVLSAAVRETIGKFSNVPMIDFDVEGRPDIPVIGTSDGTPSQPKLPDPTYNPFSSGGSSRPKTTRSDGWEKLFDLPQFSKGSQGMDDGFSSLKASSFNEHTEVLHASSMMQQESSSMMQQDSSSMTQQNWQESANFAFDTLAEENLQASLWNNDPHTSNEVSSEFDLSVPKFQHRGQYIILPCRKGLMVVDQHRAHVCVLYEQNMKCITSSARPTQRELFPAIIYFEPSEAVALEDMMSEITSLGFELSNLGGGSYSVNGVPSGIEGVNIDKLLHDMITSAMEHTINARSEAQEAMALTMAKSSAIVRGQVLTSIEIDKLLNDLFSLKTPARTPDGKLVYNIIENKDIEDKF